VILSLLTAPEAPKAYPVDAPNVYGMPYQASTFASSTDNLYFFITILNVIFFALIIGATILFMVRHARRSPDQKTSSITHNGKVEFLWSAVPTVLLIAIFIWGEIDYMKQAVPPQDAIEVRLTGRQWFWTTDYPSYPGVQLTSSVDEAAPMLVVPKGIPVKLTMFSEDVIHSFYVPAFRVKRDVLPGRYTTIWFEATRVGEYNLFCTEYCGKDHSRMAGTVVVLEPEAFEAKLKELGTLKINEGETMAMYGQRIYSRKGCNACHSIDGNPMVGPTWKGIVGRESKFTDGTSQVADDNYIRQSILEPNAKLVAGYAGQMPSYQGQLDDEQIAAVIEFMKTLK